MQIKFAEMSETREITQRLVDNLPILGRSGAVVLKRPYTYTSVKTRLYRSGLACAYVYSANLTARSIPGAGTIYNVIAWSWNCLKVAENGEFKNVKET